MKAVAVEMALYCQAPLQTMPRFSVDAVDFEFSPSLSAAI
jgi:hypothetical protein